MSTGEWFDQRPRRRRLTEMLSAQLDKVVPGDPNGKTYAEALVEALLNRATRGSVSAIKLIWLLVEGPPPRRIEVEGPCMDVRIVANSPQAGPDHRAELAGQPTALLATGTGGETAMTRKREDRKPEPIGEKLLTMKEAAGILRMNPRTLRGYVLRGEIEGRIIGGKWRFRRIDLDRFYERAPRSWDFRGKSEHGD